MADTYQQTPFRNEFCKAEQFTPQPPKVLKHAICSLKDLLYVHVHIISYSASTCIKIFKGARVDWCSGESIHLPPVLPGFNFTSSVDAVYGLKYIIVLGSLPNLGSFFLVYPGFFQAWAK